MKKLLTTILTAGMLTLTAVPVYAAGPAAYICPNGNAACVQNGACLDDGTCTEVGGGGHHSEGRHHGGHGGGHHGGR